MTSNYFKQIQKTFSVSIILLILLCFNACSNTDSSNSSQSLTQATTTSPADPNTLVDPRDNQSYKIIHLADGKTWMAENLNFKSEDSWLYNNDENNAQKYGRLYSWESAKTACPTGWRLPSDRDWASLASYYGGLHNKWDGQAKNTSKEAGTQAYASLIDGGTTSFSARLGGYRNANGTYEELGVEGFYWSADQESDKGAWYYYFISYNPNRFVRNYWDKRWGYSCRCIKN